MKNPKEKKSSLKSNVSAIIFLLAILVGGLIFWNSPNQVDSRNDQKELKELSENYVLYFEDGGEDVYENFNNCSILTQVFIVMKETGRTYDESVEILIKGKYLDFDPANHMKEEDFLRTRKMVLGY